MKIYLDTIGCRLNQAEIEQYARQFRAAGHTLVAEPCHADMAVVNTCAVTTAAEADSRQKIRHIIRYGVEQIVATGCWATLQSGGDFLSNNVTHLIPNDKKDQLANLVLGISSQAVPLEPIERKPVPGVRQRTRFFVKVQDGCNNRCTFCVTTIARGPGRSRSIRDILVELQAAESAKEIVLTGVHLGSWGKDFSQSLHLSDLIQAILRETDFPRIRLSSLEPWDLSPEFFQLWENPRLCRHLHLPLQSGCEATLRRMARRIKPKSFAGIVEAARQVIPEIAVTTDLITGFPGETDEEFEESLEFVRRMGFAGGHTFTYSARTGTAAAHMPDQIESGLRKERAARVREIFSEASAAYRNRFIGRVLPVLWESASKLNQKQWTLSGLTDNYLRVHTNSDHSLCNQITPVSLIKVLPDGLTGKIRN